MKWLAAMELFALVSLVAALAVALERRSASVSEWTAVTGSGMVPRWVWDSDEEWLSLPLPL